MEREGQERHYFKRENASFERMGGCSTKPSWYTGVASVALRYEQAA